MKDLLTILILGVFVFWSWGIAKLQRKSDDGWWSILYLPLIMLLIMYIIEIVKPYYFN